MESESIREDNENGKNMVNLTPVAPEQSGKGLPYAPENWPNPGDIWSWRTGRRIAPNGNFKDRYLYPPPRLSGPRSRRCFRSKLSVANFIKESYSHLNVADFFNSFTWLIPSGNTSAIDEASLKQFELPEEPESDCLSDIGGCKAGNLICKSLIVDEDECLPVMPCDICCAEPEFCRDCCCILCRKTVDSKYGGYSFIKCQAEVGDNICGHAGHIECALRCHIAGTVGGSIALDAEYFCQRCDGRTDLIPHAKKLLQTCQFIKSEDDDIKRKILNLCFCFLWGSQKAGAKELISQIQLATSKLNRGTNTMDIVKVDDNLTAHSGNTSAIDEASLKQSELPKQSKSDFLSENGGCKVGNPICKSLILDEDDCLLVIPCDVCCAEPEFCRDCCCILCCKTVDSKYGGYSFIKCQAKVGDNICGHVGHIECAIRCYLAGTVNGLDAEYYCRRCDGRTDLIPHAKKLLLTCSKDDDMKKKILNLCMCFLRGSQKTPAKELISQIQLAMSKLKCGTNNKDMVNIDDNLTAHSEERLNAQKKYLQNLEQQLKSEKAELANQTRSSQSNILFQTVREREKQLRREVVKYEEMKKVANGLGCISEKIIEKHFSL